MPTRIVPTGTDLAEGEISEDKLKKITDDFSALPGNVSFGGRLLEKIDAVYIPLAVMNEFLAQANNLIEDGNTPPGIDDPTQRIKVKIQFGITLPNQKDCADPTLDISNQLTAVLMIQKDGRDLNYPSTTDVDNVIITPGFKANYQVGIRILSPAFNAPPQRGCCGVGTPGHP